MQNLLKQYIAEKAPALYAKINSPLSIYYQSIAHYPLEETARKSFAFLAGLVRKNKSFIEKRPTRSIREIRDASIDDSNGDPDNDPQQPMEANKLHNAGNKQVMPWKNAKMKDIKPLRPLVRDRERPNAGSLSQNFMNPRAQSGFRNNGWTNKNNIPHIKRPPTSNVVCYKCGIGGHVAPNCRKFRGTTSRTPCPTCLNKYDRELYHDDCNWSNNTKDLANVNFIRIGRPPKNGLTSQRF